MDRKVLRLHYIIGGVGISKIMLSETLNSNSRVQIDVLVFSKITVRTIPPDARASGHYTLSIESLNQYRIQINVDNHTQTRHKQNYMFKKIVRFY